MIKQAYLDWFYQICDKATPLKVNAYSFLVVFPEIETYPYQDYFLDLLSFQIQPNEYNPLDKYQ